MASPASGNTHQTIITPKTPTSTPLVPLSHRIHALRSIVPHPFGALALSFWEGSGIFVRGSGQGGGCRYS